MHLPTIGIRSIQFLFAVIVLALSGALVHQQAFGGSPAQVNFALFTAIFAFLSLIYYFLAAFSEGFAHPLALGVLDILNLLFTLCAGIALPARLGAHSCSNRTYLATNAITNGGYNMKGRCQEAQALSAFLWFLFFSFVASAVFTARNIRMKKTSTSAPSMSQV